MESSCYRDDNYVGCVRVKGSSSYRGDEFELKGENLLKQTKLDLGEMLMFELGSTAVWFIEVKCQKNLSYRGGCQKCWLTEVSCQNNLTYRGATLLRELFELSAPVPQLFELLRWKCTAFSGVVSLVAPDAALTTQKKEKEREDVGIYWSRSRNSFSSHSENRLCKNKRIRAW